jgi:hypothetical protein
MVIHEFLPGLPSEKQVVSLSENLLLIRKEYENQSEFDL